MFWNFRGVDYSFFHKLILIQFALLLTVYVNGSKENENANNNNIKEKMVNDFARRPHHNDERRIMYFGIAASAASQTYSRAFNKTLMNITQSYLASKSDRGSYNISLETLVIELPQNGSFSAVLLETLCEQFEGKHVVAVLIIGDSPAAFTVSLAAKHAGIPVLWARGHSGLLPGFRNLVSGFVLNRHHNRYSI